MMKGGLQRNKKGKKEIKEKSKTKKEERKG